MTQSLTEALAERAEEAVRAGHWELDRTAWNLPRIPLDVARHDDDGQLDWQGFCAAYYPAARRHDLAAIAAYAAYRGTPPYAESHV